MNVVNSEKEDAGCEVTPTSEVNSWNHLACSKSSDTIFKEKRRQSKGERPENKKMKGRDEQREKSVKKGRQKKIKNATTGFKSMLQTVNNRSCNH